MIEIRPLAEDWSVLLERASACAPYLRRLISRDLDALELGSMGDLEDAYDPWIRRWTGALAALETTDTAMPTLRAFKREGHLLIALQDLAGCASGQMLTTRLSAMADLAVETALRLAAQKTALATNGLTILALGKHGAQELNYSSDIDLVAIYDPHRFDGGDRDPSDAASRIIRDLITMFENVTGDGYVFRTDFRLRPDPSSTPLAVSTEMAELYYESVGQNWERMVYIKARPCAGDIAVGDAFLATLEPFVWRRHLDYWAISDVHAIKRMINAKVGDPDLGNVAADLKLGPGGIREIEFFAQTQQVILGGRDSTLRDPTTCGALVRLADAGVIDWPVSRALTEAYWILRGVEHRVQMLNDAQTHSLPRSDDERDKVAQLCGYASRAALEADLVDLRQTVHAHYQDLFSEEARQTARAIEGNLVFTGVDIDPASIKTLERMGFSAPDRVIATVQSWHRGGVPATRSDRGRQLLTAVLPGLLDTMSNSGEPDAAFANFATFFEGLSAGVQLLSMLVAEDAFADDLVATLALAPRLARTLSRKPACLEALIDGGEVERFTLPQGTDFETAMDKARRYHKEASLLVGHKLLHGRLTAREAGAAWTGLADATVVEMAKAAERETERRFGPAPGVWQVVAMGKLGGEELTAGSDLDLMVLFDPKVSGGEAQTWFSRFTQRLISALSAPTAEGLLYEIDMRLRPSGGAGPVAVSLAAFERYQRDEAWTWEHMALTRIRPITGDFGLAKQIMERALSAIVSRAQNPAILADIADMHARLGRDKPAKGFWDFKRAPGGLVDIEFVVQAALLTSGDAGLVTGNTSAAIGRLSKAGIFAPRIAETLNAALVYQQALQQVVRLALGDIGPDHVFSAGLENRLYRAVGQGDFAALKTRLSQLRADVTEIFQQKIPIKTTEPPL
ncbi:MAG: bifunctional [glutamine synthetase] adenylyltransferase/[glutamine synthetase]-adenylyl-L-tyrosine phosphorylase [Pseudomonadota bacterium]